MIATICPDRQTLLRYSLGMLPDEQREAFDSHLDGCADCQAIIVTLDDADDTAIGRLRMPLSGDSLLAEPQLQEALAASLGMPARTPDADMPEMLGEYRLLAELGRGGMGRVYKALHTKLDRVVAVKVLSGGRAGDANAASRFAREMKAVGRLVHPNIVHAHDAREIDGTAVLIMELVDGLDLAEIVRRAGVPALAGNLPSAAGRGAGGEGGGASKSPAGKNQSPPKGGTPARGIPVPDACELIRQTALALQCAHDHGLVHRDVKPSNIMLARSGDVKLLDLGLARFFAGSGAGVPPACELEEMTDTGQAMGTADYMAPEQASDSRTVDIRADIYSLGCTFYKLLTGRAPFSGPEYRTTLDKMNAHVHQPVPPVRNIMPEVPEQLATVLDRMLAKEPAARFATPAEVAEAIAPFCAGADLPALLKKAEEGQQGQQGQQGEDANLPSPSGIGAGGEGGAGREGGVAAPQPATHPRRLKSLSLKLLAILLFGGLCFALGIIIRIKKDGHTTTIDLPPGSNAQFSPDGKVDVELPKTTTDSHAINDGRVAPSGAMTLARVLIRDIRAALAAGKLSQAESLCRQLDALRIPENAFGAEEDSPGRVFETVHKAQGLVRALGGGGRATSASTSTAVSTGSTPAKPRAQSQSATPAAPLPTVRVTQPVVCNVCDYEEYTGRIEKADRVGITSPATGHRIFKVASDGTVKEGDLLAIVIPPDEWERLLPKNKQMMRAAQNLRNAERSHTSDALLAKAKEESKSAREEWDRACDSAKAAKVFSPYSGRITSFWSEDTKSSTVASIALPDCMMVTFDVPEPTVLAHRRLPNRKPNWELSLPVVCALADDKGFPYRGKVVSVAEAIDPGTHAQRWQAMLPNKDSIFMPGMSVRVRVITSEPHKVMLIPTSLCYTDVSLDDAPVVRAKVYVVNDRSIVEPRDVRFTRQQYDGLYSVEGIKADDWVVARTGHEHAPTIGKAVRPEKITMPPPPWAEISVPPAVSVVRPVAREVSDYEDYTGRVDKGVETEVVSPIKGAVKFHFKPEMPIKRGDLLAEVLSDADWEKIASLQNRLANAQQLVANINLPRSAEDRKRLAQAEEQLKKARAELDAGKNTVKYIKILAPCSGKIRSYLVTPLDHELQVDTGIRLLSIVSYDSVYAVFDVDERTVVQLRRRMADRLPDWELSRTVLCGLNGDAGFPLRGKVTSVDSEIDRKTGTQHWHVLLPNKDGVLLPGMFLRVRLLTSDPHKALLVPERALGSEGKFVFVVGDQDVAQRRDVEVGQLQDDGLRIVTKGLSGDDRVVCDSSKVTAGMTVKPEEPAATPGPH